MDYTNKEIIKDFYFVEGNKNGVKTFKLNGREYIKTGIYQGITFAGILFKIYDDETSRNKYKLFIGYSKQHVDDKFDKKIGYEQAYMNTLMNPCMVIDVENKNLCDYSYFINYVYNKLNDIKLNFVRTKEEKNLL